MNMYDSNTIISNCLDDISFKFIIIAHEDNSVLLPLAARSTENGEILLLLW